MFVQGRCLPEVIIFKVMAERADKCGALVSGRSQKVVVGKVAVGIGAKQPGRGNLSSADESGGQIPGDFARQPYTLSGGDSLAAEAIDNNDGACTAGAADQFQVGV